MQMLVLIYLFFCPLVEYVHWALSSYYRESASEKQDISARKEMDLIQILWRVFWQAPHVSPFLIKFEQEITQDQNWSIH